MEHANAHAQATSKIDAAPRPCSAVEGVEFWISPAPGRPLRCVITGAALQTHYGAHGDGPDSWLTAFHVYRDDIEGRACAAAARRDDVHVVLVTDAHGRLKAVAGRCGR